MLISWVLHRFAYLLVNLPKLPRKNTKAEKYKFLFITNIIFEKHFFIMRKFLSLLMGLMLTWSVAMAVPAKPGIHTVTQPDGSTLQVVLAGDEWHHSYVTLDGFTIQQADDGFYYYLTSVGITEIRVNDVENRTEQENLFLKENNAQMTMPALYEARFNTGKLRSKTKGVSLKAASEVPTSGSPKIPILLVQYSDISMKHTLANFQAHYNTQTWSVLRYFTDQSKGAFTPQFDVYGIYTLNNNRAYYGGNNSSGDDQRVGQMVSDAISKAGNNVNWAQYDNDGDGYVDACIVVYAGPGESSGASSNTIWPCQWYLSSAIGSYVTRNNTKIDKFAVFCELSGSSDSGTTLDGVGTFCHEFSHCLGLPDFYPTNGSNHFGMGDWSLLHQGCYNGNGDRPCGYTAYERNFMGWINLTSPVEGTTYTTATVDADGQAFKITSNNSNEYYIIENIQKTGWNQYAQASGLLVNHVNYNATKWNNNTVNNDNAQGMTIIPADNTLATTYSGGSYYPNTSGEAGDLYPYNGNNQLTSTSTPAATLYNSSTNLNKPITNITKNSNGTVSFTYMDANAASGGTASDAYLDIAKYNTIDATTWNTSYVDNMYKYTEYPNDKCAWLTMSVYGAWSGVRYSTNNPQKWITTDASSASSGNTGTTVMGLGEWEPSDIFLGSDEYFPYTTSRFFGTGRTSTSNNSTARTITFQVTNVTGIKLIGMNNNVTLDNYPTRLQVYECTKNADGTLTQSSNTPVTGGNLSSTSRNTAVNFSVTNLDPTKYYKVVASTTRAKLYEIGFQTPLDQPKLTVDPANVYMSTEPGGTTTATFNVKGMNLESAVNLTLNDANNVFSISPTSISVDNAQSSNGINVTVTFSPLNAGNFTGTVTITSGTLSKTVNLNGTCAEKGTAQGEYLDIAKYATIDQPEGWYSNSYANPYKYSEYPNEGSAWLTVPASIAYIGYDEGNQGWVSLNQNGNPYWYGHQWAATDVFAGHEYFKCDELTDEDGDYAYMLGANVASSAVTTNTNMFYGMYFVTNCTQVKSYGYNNSGATSEYPSFILIYELTEGADGTLTQGEDAVDVKTYSTANAQYTLASAELDPEKIYFVAVGGYRGFVYEVSFRTPMEGLPGVPTIVSAEPTATTSEITWTPGEDNDSWDLRYREYVDPEDAIVFFDDFENGLGNWTIYTRGTAPQADGWTITSNGQLNGVEAVSGSNMASAWSWSGSAYNANNWLITPQVTFGKELSFWVRTAGSWPDSYEVLLSTSSNAERNFNVTLQAMATAPTNNQWNKVNIDLSQYEGQTGYIAIHHVSEDCNYLLIDDFGIYNELPGEWIEVDDVESPYTITGLTPETTYEVQVQGVGEGGATSAWTPSTLFTTLAIQEATLAEIESRGVLGTTYTISDELMAIHFAQVGDYIYLWCKDQAESINPAPAIGDKIDFLGNDRYAQAGNPWDESNWVVLKFSVGSDQAKVTSITGAVNHKLNRGTITGIYSDVNNYTITMPAGEGLDTRAVYGEECRYTPNVYCVANFNQNYLTEAGAQSKENGNVYFFMTPKVQEVCEITYAVWNGEYFMVPESSGFEGSLSLDWTYNESGDVTDDLNVAMDNNTTGTPLVYRFLTVAQRVGTTMSPMIKAEAGSYKVAPLSLTAGSIADVPTAIGTVKGSRDVVEVYYVNTVGVTSKNPFSGVNVVVTRYSDGSKTSVKKVFK